MLNLNQSKQMESNCTREVLMQVMLCFRPAAEPSATVGANGINLNQSCHDRAHTDSVPNTQV